MTGSTVYLWVTDPDGAAYHYRYISSSEGDPVALAQQAIDRIALREGWKVISADVWDSTPRTVHVEPHSTFKATAVL